ncbi:MAG: phosphoribosylformylglycinamidine synthase subunit PurL [Nitrososphaerota archaeon]|nr:phosphoribosylformylglycinamidine synthase subunit PurL [Nitrososphaerota archaeon]
MTGLESLRLGLSPAEIAAVRKRLGREPNEVEWSIIDAEWSEHSSYKSSKALLKLFPTKGKRVVLGPGYDAGVVDVGGGYVVTLHIESHNHPSAVDPYGGASTGIGGVLRDILSMGTRPIALVDILRFGRIENSPRSRWLFRNVTRGIADYGNCVGVPTVAGDIEFDESFENNCLVDVACVGIGRKGRLILGEAKYPGDLLVLVGGSTGRDGIRGAAFASKNLSKSADDDRSSVQVPDPFTKKLLIDSLLEVADTGLLRGMKDLGGGGLSTALSEVASNGGTGVDVDLDRVRCREAGMPPAEIMISESQERMLLMLKAGSTDAVFEILDKYEVSHSTIGRVTDDGLLTIRWKGAVVARLPAEFVVKAPLIPWPSKEPAKVRRATPAARTFDVGRSVLSLLASPNIASKRWVYQQYDHEVGLRTVLKPGQHDSALLKLPNGHLLAVKGDGNSAQCAIDPYNGAAGCVAESCRNVVAVGGEPIAMVDHLQFGDPSDPEVYWSFRRSIEGMADYCAGLGLPVVGGKVSFYNEDSASKKAIKPSPISLVVGLVEDEKHIVPMGFVERALSVVVAGETRAELGGSEYYRLLGALDAGTPPHVDVKKDAALYRAVLDLIRSGTAASVHDVSRGGVAIALAEMCLAGGSGAAVDLGALPSASKSVSALAFSESHGRFLIATDDPRQAGRVLRSSGIPFAIVGETGGDSLVLRSGTRVLSELENDVLHMSFEESLPRMMD